MKELQNKLGLNPDNFEIIETDTDNIIINHNSNIYILFDSNYNIIGIENLENLNTYEELRNKILLIYNYYLNTPDGINTLFTFPYPFQNYTLKDIIDIGYQTDILKCILEEKTPEREIRLLSYLKLLSIEINNYFIYTYKMKLLNLDVPNVYLFTISLINKINTLSSNLLSNIGESPKNINLSYLAYNVRDLLKEENKTNHKNLDILANSILDKNNKSFQKRLKK